MFNDSDKISGKVFNNLSKGAKAYVEAIKNAEGATGKFKASFTGLGAAMKANPVGAVIASIVALITVIKIAENAYDKAHDNLDDLSEKGETISEELSNIRSEIDQVDEQIAELSRQKLSITDSSDISVLNTQIELLEQRKELLEWQEANKKKEEENTANAKIEGTKNNSVYDGASYADWNSGKLTKSKNFFNSTLGAETLATVRRRHIKCIANSVKNTAAQAQTATVTNPFSKKAKISATISPASADQIPPPVELKIAGKVIAAKTA